MIELIGATLVSQPSLVEIDLKPVIAYPAGQGVLALDGLMLVRHPNACPAQSPAPRVDFPPPTLTP